MIADGESGDNNGLFGKDQGAKKRRKSRTAFTNQQIYELEKRFLYQKYLTPADRDEIAQQLGLSNAQVITWFQNRRAKLKRDLEELKADVSAAKVIGKEPPGLLTRLEEMQAFTTHHSLLKWDKKHMKSVGGGCGNNGGKYPSAHGASPAAAAAARFNSTLMNMEQREAFLNSTLKELRKSPNIDSGCVNANRRPPSCDDSAASHSPADDANKRAKYAVYTDEQTAQDYKAPANSVASMAIDYSVHKLRQSETVNATNGDGRDDSSEQQYDAVSSPGHTDVLSPHSSQPCTDAVTHLSSRNDDVNDVQNENVNTTRSHVDDVIRHQDNGENDSDDDSIDIDDDV